VNNESEVYLRKTSTQVPKLVRFSRSAFSFLYPFLVIGLIWEVVVRVGLVNTPSLPTPTVIMQKFWDLAVNSGVLWQNLAASFYRLMIGYLLAVVAGTVVGALLSLNRTLSDLFKPMLSLLISVPAIAWIPVLLVSIGLSDETVIITVFLGSFFAITYNTMRGIEMVPTNLVRAGQLMGLRGVRLFLDVLLPGSLVSIINGLRLGIGYAWRALVGGEMLAAMIDHGLGKMVFDARFFNDITVMFVGIIVIGLSGLLLDRFFLRWLEMATVEKWGMQSRREVYD
jgi:ABC-type nitrate/sulfonate/bicarbonate transport system permease component